MLFRSAQSLSKATPLHLKISQRLRDVTNIWSFQVPVAYYYFILSKKLDSEKKTTSRYPLYITILRDNMTIMHNAYVTNGVTSTKS